MKKNISIVIFILILVVGSVLYIQCNGFTLCVDLASKIATVSVLFWAVHTHIEQKKDKKISEKNQRLKELSYRLIDYIGHSTFSLNKNSANILITYLESIKEEADETDVTSEQLKEYKLALSFSSETLKNTSLMDVISVESANDYNEVIKVLKEIYSDPDQLNKLDPEFNQTLQQSPRGSVHHPIMQPSGIICLQQIKKIMAFLLEVEESELHKELSTCTQPVINHPVLYALYYFYTHGHLFVEDNGDYTVTADNPTYIRPCRRPDMIPTNQAGLVDESGRVHSMHHKQRGCNE